MVVQEWMRWSSIFDQWDTDGNGYVSMGQPASLVFNLTNDVPPFGAELTLQENHHLF